MHWRNGLRCCVAASILLPVGRLSAQACVAPASAEMQEAATTAVEPAKSPSSSAAAAKPSAKPQPFKNPLYDSDYRYLDDTREKTEYYELLKRLPVGESLSIDVGGEYRHQFKDEDRRSLFIGTAASPRWDAFSLNRLRVYANVSFSDWLRGYAEVIDAVSIHEDLPPLAIDENRSDVLNLFTDVLLHVGPGPNCRETWLRFGRQELLYDAERLISPLDWANTRRTFDGVKLFSRDKLLDIDAFFTRPVRVLPRSFDQPDQSQWFAGIYTTYKGFEHQNVSMYLLALREEDVIPGMPTGATHRIGSGNHDNRLITNGSRLWGERDDWLWELEGALQLGRSDAQELIAGAIAVGIGRKFTGRPLEPTIWMWYDYASGDEDPTDGNISTFNQLFPLAHKYFGFLDLVARQNVHDLNWQVFVKPTKKLTVLTWLHLMWLAEGQDALYNSAGIASRQDPTGASGREIGQEIDLLATYAVRSGVEFQFGYSVLLSGDFIRNTGDGDNAHLIYTQLSVKF
jgi:hypothetical protein